MNTLILFPPGKYKKYNIYFIYTTIQKYIVTYNTHTNTNIQIRNISIFIIYG